MGDYADDAIDDSFFEMLNNESDLANSSDFDGGDGRIIRKAGDKCPKCNGRVMKRTNSKTGQYFYGCSKFPQCKWTL